MDFSPELMVAFGGFLTVMSLRQRSPRKKRQRGTVALPAIFLETLVLLIGLGTLLYGVLVLLP